MAESRTLSEHQAEKLLEGVSTVINSILNTQSGAGTSASIVVVYSSRCSLKVSYIRFKWHITVLRDGLF